MLHNLIKVTQLISRDSFLSLTGSVPCRGAPEVSLVFLQVYTVLPLTYIYFTRGLEEIGLGWSWEVEFSLQIHLEICKFLYHPKGSKSI